MWFGLIPWAFVVPAGISQGMACENQIANKHTPAHAANEIANPSAIDMRSSLKRDAPNDWRTAVSLCLTTERASIRFATFEQTISKVIAVTTEKMARKRPPICDTPAFV